MEHGKRKLRDFDLPDRAKYRFDELEVGEAFKIKVRKDERDRKFHACRTRCKQMSVNGKSFAASVDDCYVYYKRIS